MARPERCVCDLQASLDLGQSLLSHHLRVLREAGLVRSRRDGRWVHYQLSDDALMAGEAWISEKREGTSTAAPHGSRC
ncbi:MAG: metalloregulator ArsR/SmtB family transcription factor [Gemmatimonadetes bacterium]|nr:metalloregulator ArsR/SmtB family transcription factor [Gemmatimonadota bacterium]NNK48891.1 helix-turn-helix transcriptional regulator [Gemmatimonadota bacterium]